MRFPLRFLSMLTGLAMALPVTAMARPMFPNSLNAILTSVDWRHAEVVIAEEVYKMVIVPGNGLSVTRYYDQSGNPIHREDFRGQQRVEAVWVKTSDGTRALIELRKSPKLPEDRF